MTDDEFLNHAAESLDDDVLKQLRQELASIPNPVLRYEYFVLADDKQSPARLYVSRDGVMTRKEIVAQLRRLADYVEKLTDEQARRP